MTSPRQHDFKLYAGEAGRSASRRSPPLARLPVRLALVFTLLIIVGSLQSLRQRPGRPLLIAGAQPGIEQLNNRQLLAVLLSDKVGECRAAEALREAGRRKLPGLLRAGRRLLRHKSLVVRTAAVRAVRASQHPKGADFLIKTLRDSDPLVRGTAANALRAFGSSETLRHLRATYAREEVPEVKFVMRRAIEKLGGTEIEADTFKHPR